MKLIKTSGVVIKEVQYSDNDKILTILTDNLGLVTAMAKGAKKNNSSLLASCQYLVYSEFVLFKGTNFYHINSADPINTFYKLRTNFDKMTEIFELTKLVNRFTEENMETSDILKVFLNTLHVIMTTDKQYITSIFLIRLFTLLGFTPDVLRCNFCHKDFSELKELNGNCVWYNYSNNYFICETCKSDELSGKINTNVCFKITFKTFMNIRYIMYGDYKKIFSIVVDEKMVRELNKFSQYLVGCITTNL